MRRFLPCALALSVWATACASPSPELEVGIVRDLTFLRATDEGVSLGFDLDGLVSDEADPDGCYREDLVSPEGVPGIDNAFSNILPALELTQASALEPLIKAAIDEGRLLLMISLSDLDDRVEDECVDVRISRSIGPPALGGDGLILPGQTYEHDPDAPESTMECGVLTEGKLVAAPLNIRLPLQVFDEQIDLSLYDGVYQMELLPEGGYRGHFAGGISIAELMTNVYSFDGVGDDVVSLLESVLGTNADLSPDESGVCQRLSVGFQFEAVSAYFFEDETEAGEDVADSSLD